MASHEILTLQIGHFANFVGTHWWNLQEASFSYDPKFPSEINNDIMFREGCTPQGATTYLPRLVSIDLKGSLKSLKKDGVLYRTQTKEDSYFWTDSLDVHKTTPFSMNEFLKSLESQEKLRNEIPHDCDNEKDVCQVLNAGNGSEDFASQNFNLDSSVDVWSDYLCMHLHPRSIHLIQKYLHRNDVEPFDVFHYGVEVMSEDHEVDGIENRVRFFVEECDNLQGFHLLFDGGNGFGGVATAVASYLSDEFKKSLLAVPVFDISSGEQRPFMDQTTLLDSFLSFEKISTLSGLVLPLSCFESPWCSLSPVREFPFLDFKKDLPYHGSAVLASAIDTASIFYRRKDNSNDLRELVDSLGVYGRKFAALTAVIPFPLYRDVSIVEAVLRSGPDLIPRPLTPGCDVARSQSLIQHLVFRGLPTGAKLNLKDLVQHVNFPKNLTCLDDLLSWFASEMCPSSFSSMNKLTDGLNVSDPFPHIFNPKVSSLGMICPEDRPAGEGVKRVPVMSGLHSSNNFKKMLNDLVTKVGALNIHKLHSFTSAGLEQDELVQSAENLKLLMSCYDNP